MTDALLLFKVLLVVHWSLGIVGASLASDLRGLRLSPGTEIDPPSNTTERWSSFHAPSYKVTIKPATDQDVATIVRKPSSTGGSFRCPHQEALSYVITFFLYFLLTSCWDRSNMRLIPTHRSSQPVEDMASALPLEDFAMVSTSTSQTSGTSKWMPRTIC
jgi:hypothetical protein